MKVVKHLASGLQRMKGNEDDEVGLLLGKKRRSMQWIEGDNLLGSEELRVARRGRRQDFEDKAAAWVA